MTQTSSPWDGILLGDAANAPYSSNEWAHLWKLLHGAGSVFPNYGILAGSGDGTYEPLQAVSTGSANIDVKIGAALVNGKLYETDAAVPFTISANASGNPRIDTAVLRVDYVAQTVRPVVKQGTPAASPARPSLTQNTTLWEIPLADIAVANGFSSLTQADITDRRRYMHSSGAGWQPYAYPINTSPTEAYSDAYILQPGFGIAIPIIVSGNMLVDQLAVIGRAASSPSLIWGIYVEDVNDGNNTSKSVRRIGGRSSNGTVAVTNGNKAAFPATPAPFPLAQGSYWLIMVGGSANLTFGSKTSAASSFAGMANNALFNSGLGSSLAQTIDLTSGWGISADSNDSYGIRLEGRVFDQVTAF